jgi:hypothetical protein
VIAFVKTLLWPQTISQNAYKVINNFTLPNPSVILTPEQNVKYGTLKSSALERGSVYIMEITTRITIIGE